MSITSYRASFRKPSLCTFPGAAEGVFQNVPTVHTALSAMLQENTTLRSLIIDGEFCRTRFRVAYSGTNALACD